MCGIAGYVGRGDEQVLSRMVSSLKHRGPDGDGVFHEGQVGLAHTRLAVIDLTPSGRQPMHSTTGRSVIVFNGEIYNHQALRASIEQGGAYRFQSHSDTEVILALYETHGSDAFAMLDGMFAIALYDVSKQTLFLVRDRVGEKPLYYAESGGTLFFGSELKALMCHPLWQSEIDPISLARYLTAESVPTPRSIFRGVHKLPPATILAFSGGKVSEIKEFWSLSSARSNDTFPKAVQSVDTLLGTSVERMLVADVPVGIFLSGGIDSSTVAYYATKKAPGAVHTFSIGFEERSYDESHYAKQVADHLGTIHHTEMFSSRTCLDILLPTLRHLDEPLADASTLPTALLSRFTREHVTVALGGDGGDELFAGYSTFQAEALLEWYLRLPEMVRQSFIEPLIRNLPPRDSYMSLDFRLKKFLDGAHATRATRHQQWLGAFSEDELSVLLRRDVRAEAASGPTRETMERFFDQKVGGPREQMLYAYLRSYLSDQVLVKVDRASMMHALEVRAPFLDHHLLSYVHSLPYAYKFSGLSGKRILKKLMRDRLPRQVISRAKKGFAIPTGAWLRGPLKKTRDELLSSSGLYSSRLFNEKYIEQLKAEHDSGRFNHQKKLWTLFVFALWYDAWGTSSSEGQK